MRLQELLGVKAHYEKDIDELVNDIEGGGKLRQVGKGALARVLSHRNGYVYKFWVKDSSYDTYIDYVAKCQSNPHVPKLKSKVKELTAFFKRPEQFPDKIKYVKMEKLEKFDKFSTFPGCKNLLVGTAMDIIVDTLNENPSDDLDEKIARILRRCSGKEDLSPAGKVEKQIEALAELVNDLIDLPGRRKYFDLHVGNVMNRGGVVVITDPLVNDDDIDFNQTLEKLNDLLPFSPGSKTGPSRKKTKKPA